LRLKELEGLQETQLQKFLAFQAQYKSKLDLAVNDLILVLKDYGITLPDSG